MLTVVDSDGATQFIDLKPERKGGEELETEN